MATITSNQTSYTNPNATLSVTATAQRISNSQISITANWTIYTAGSAQTSGTAYRYLVLCNSSGSALAYASMNRGTWASNTTYTGSCIFTVNASQGTTSMVIGFKVSASNTSISSSGTLIWNGNKSTNTGNPAMQTGSVTFVGTLSAPVLTSVLGGDYSGSSFAIFALASNATRVRCAVWNNENGQDDLEWKDLSPGTWVRNGLTYNYANTYFLSNHGNLKTTYNCHVYAYNSGSESAFLAEVVYLRKNIYFNGNGGTDAETRDLAIGMNVGTLPTSTRTGYTLKGWFTEPEGGTQISATTPVINDITIPSITYYAQWRANTYTLTYNANGGNVSPTSKSVTYDSAYGTLATPSRTGYTFLGWYTAASGGTKVTSSTVCKGSDTIYAHWRANTYTLTYNANGGSVTPSSKTSTYDSAWGNLETPTRLGYSFLGWFTDPEEGIEVTSSTICQGNLTVYAHWEKSAIPIPDLQTFLKIGVDPEYPCDGWYSVTANIEALNIQNNSSIGISDTKPYISNCSNFTGRIDGNGYVFTYSIDNTSSNFQNFTGIFNKFSGELNNLYINITIDGNYQKVCGFCDVLSGEITTSIDGAHISNTQNDGITSGICYEMNQGTVSDVSIGLSISSNGPAAGIAYKYISGEVSSVDVLPIDGISGKDYVGGLFSIYHMSESITPLGSDIITGNNITGKDYVGGIIGKLMYQEGNGTADIIQENVTNILCNDDIVGDNYVGIIGYSELQNITPYSAIQRAGTIFSRKSNASSWIGNIEDDNMLKLSSDNTFIKNGDSVSIQASGGNNSIESAYYSVGYSEDYGTEITSTGSQGFSNPISVAYDKTTMGEGAELYVRIGSDTLVSTIIFPIKNIIGYYGNIPILEIYYGDKKIVKIYKGNRKIF